MVNTPYPLPRQKRESDVLVGNGSAGPYGPSLYKIFDIEDVTIWTRPAGALSFADVSAGCTIVKTNGAQYDTFSVTFWEPIPASTEWYHSAKRVAQRSLAVTRAGSLDAPQLEQELSKQASAQSELRRDVDAIPRFRIGPGFDPIIEARPNEFLGLNAAGDKIIGKGTPGELGAGDMLASNNLSDVDDAAEARDNLGVTAAIDALGVPPVTIADAGKSLLVKTDGSGFEVKTLLPATTIADAGKVLAVKSDGTGYEIHVGETFINLANFCVCDGLTDDSAALQAVIDANKGKALVLPEDKVLLAAGVYLNGASYNGTKLNFRGEFKLKPAATIGTNNGFGQVYSGIEVRDCEVEINGRFNGNRGAQQNREQTIVITVSGAKLRSREKLIFREIRGDGLYITQRDYNTLSADPEFDLAYVYGANSADDGRNLLSVISCARGTIGTFISRNIGGVVGGFQMPGGLDCEPNYSGQKVQNVTIGTIDIIGAGSSNLQFYGARFSDAAHTVPEANASPANINIGVARVINTIAAGAADEFTNVTQSNYACCLIEGVVGVTIGYLDTEFLNAYGDALIVRNGAANVTIKGRAKKVRSVLLGTGVSGSERGCKNLNIHFDMDDISRFGHTLGVVEGGRLSGRLTNPKTAYYSNRFAVHTLPPSGAGSLTDVELSHEIPGNANWTRSYRHSAGMTYPGTVINGAKLPSGSWAAEVNRIGDMPVSRANCPGVNDMSSIPTGGTWVAGDRVRNNNAATVGTTSNWVRLTNGAAHVSGTDWKLIA